MRTKLGHRNVLKIAGVLLIAAVIVLSSTAIAATTQPVSVRKNTTGTGARSVNLLTEGFEVGTMPPSGWKHIIYNTQYTWKIVANPVHSGAKAAQCPRDNNQQDEWLTSPNIDLTYYQAASLDFWCNTTLYGTADMQCDVVVQGHNINDVIWKVTNENYDEWATYAWREKTLDLTGYAEKIINVSWHYYGGGGKKNFGLDDILVSGTPKTPPPALNISKISGGMMKISAEIKDANNATGDDAINVTWSITAVGNGILRKLNFSANGTIPQIDHNGGIQTVTLSKDTELNKQPIVGFGTLAITVKADIPDNPRVEPVQRTAKGLLFIFYVIIQ